MVVLARWCIRRRNLVVFGWIAMLVALGGVVGAAGSAFSDSSRLPASDSSTAYNLLAQGGSDAAKVKTGVWTWSRLLSVVGTCRSAVLRPCAACPSR